MSTIDYDVKNTHSKIQSSVFYHADEYWLCVLSRYQQILLMNETNVLQSYSVSTAKNGLGCKNGSYQTPTGLHFIQSKIGSNTAINKIFKARVETENFAEIISEKKTSDEDLITSRILRLSGLEYLINNNNGVDSFKRYIYIHGTNEEGMIGQAVSHGCIRMKNKDVIDLFDKTPEQTLVYIS